MKLTTITHVSVDGVMQGLGGPDEDRRGGFDRGGWALPLFVSDNEAVTFVNQVYQRAGAFLFGRRTYEIFAGSWGIMTDSDNPIAAALNIKPKYVAPTTHTDPRWADTAVLSGDVAAAVGGEQPHALADDHRDGDQGHLVHQVVGQQPPDQGAAAVHLQLTRRLGLQLGDGRGEVAGQDGRVRPARLGERGRRDVLGLCVQGSDDGVVQVFPHAPVAGEQLVGPPAEQERLAALVHLLDERHGLAVEQRPGPVVSGPQPVNGRE